MATDLPSYQSEVLSLTHVANDYYELKVKIPAGLHWQSGQYIRLGLPTKTVTDKKKGSRPFACCPRRSWLLAVSHPDPANAQQL